MPIPTRIVLGAVLTLIAATTYVLGQAKSEKSQPVTRAKPPVFKPADTAGIFFDDVFKDGLVGARPANLGAPPVGTSVATSSSSASSDAASSVESHWHELISGEVIEDEVKRLSTTLSQEITTPGKFNGGGYQDARVNFTMLAMLFAVAGEHKNDVRWQKDAPELRDFFARAAAGTKVGSTQSYNQAKIAKDQLEDLVRGTAFSSAKPGDRKTDWSQTADRVPIMKRLEISVNKKMAPMVANAGEFKSNKDALRHEASLVAVMAETLAQEGMSDADDEGYRAHATNMRTGAKDILSAIELDNYDQARQASGVISQACSNCHDEWR